MISKLGQYYTQDLFSALLVNQIKIENPKSIIDLGVGAGSLVKAAINRWTGINYYAADVDEKSVNKIKKEFPFVQSFHVNTLTDNVAKKLDILTETMDIAVCNPPFLKIKSCTFYDELFEKAYLGECKGLRHLTSEIVFLAKNLQLLKSKGELGIILPDSLITGNNFEILRKAILQQYEVKALIELPEGIYPKTEALTHILIISKNECNNKNTSLLLADKKGNIVDSIEVEKSALIQRMDYKYHSWKKNTKVKIKGDLSSINADIKRGLLTQKELLATKDNFVHTTHLKKLNGNLKLKSCKNKNKNYLLAEPGDILLSRVGRSCSNKICMVTRGKSPISDCVYRIRVASHYKDKVWQALISSQGQNWLRAISHGVCAKVISKRDLLRFPIE